jgi:solute carrier family 50 protein (sugar transporter)
MFSPFPYVCTLLSNMLWLYYGILDSSGILLITIGSSGCAFQALYLSIYLIYAASAKDRVMPYLILY